MSVSDLKTLFQKAQESEEVQSALEKWNLFRDTKANLFSEKTSEAIAGSNLIPQAVKDTYAEYRDKVASATLGVATSNVFTAALRYQKPINKGIDLAVQGLDAAGQKLNPKIDEYVAKHFPRKEQEVTERELPVINYDNDAELANGYSM